MDNQRLASLPSLFGAFCRDEVKAKARCLVVSSLRLGTHFTAAEHGTRWRADVGKVVLRWLAA